ncbi:MAG: SAM-dependent methyltransferase [Proteobacteria bacterium]|nr:MAG: SAM-dependent methyltransferase [Pseudomonadota bacterium]
MDTIMETDPVSKSSVPNRNTHIEFLRNQLFQIETKWPHYGQLMKDTLELADEQNAGSRILCLERAYIYNGISLFAPLFDKGELDVVDCVLNSAEERAGYQRSWLDESKCVLQQSNLSGRVTELPVKSAFYDLVYIPNLVHHVKDQSKMFSEIARVMKPGAKGYIFEPLLREIHQHPDDYVRYTPSGFEDVLVGHGLTMTDCRPVGGPFEAIAYCWVQALQYFPEEVRKEKEKWFFDEHFKELMKWNLENPINLVRKHTSFPIAYGVFFEKPFR